MDICLAIDYVLEKSSEIIEIADYETTKYKDMSMEFLQRYYELNPAKRHYLYSVALAYPLEKYGNKEISLSEYMFDKIPLELRESF